MTVNTLLKESLKRRACMTYLLPYYENGLDAVIVQDFGVAGISSENISRIWTSTPARR